MESEGESANGPGQSLTDLNDCINTLKKEEKLKGYDFSVMGHSWGGFSTLNIAALHPEISHVVVMSGFISVEVMLSQFLPSFLSKPFIRIEKKYNPESLKHNAVETLSNTKAKVLLIYSDNDPAVKSSVHFEALRKGLQGKDNIKLMLVSDKGHNPNYTKEAVGALAEYTKAVNSKRKELTTDEAKKAFRESFDWEKITEQDESVWAEIFNALDN
jgi:dipeptidyl aminopeptidase/acylaminoacyl peptidase